MPHPHRNMIVQHSYEVTRIIVQRTVETVTLYGDASESDARRLVRQKAETGAVTYESEAVRLDIKHAGSIPLSHPELGTKHERREQHDPHDRVRKDEGEARR